MQAYRLTGDTQRPTTGSAGHTRRRFIALLAGVFGALGAGRASAGPHAGSPAASATSAVDVYKQVVPSGGIATKISFADSIAKLVAAGVIDPPRYRDYAGTLPAWVERALLTSSDEPILFNRETAPHLLILLWAVGLANKTEFNAQSPIATVSIPGFASTGGWTFGKQDGYLFFNSVDAVPQAQRQQQAVLDVATRTYRPCCDNSTFFQDCNHGSALLGLLELAASQGATSKDLYRIALAANSYWFPESYAKIALYFLHLENKNWPDVDPSRILSADFSSASGWQINVDEPLRRAGVELPGAPGEQSEC